MRVHHIISLGALLLLTACQQSEIPPPADTVADADVAVTQAAPEPVAEMPSRFDIYATVRLTADAICHPVRRAESWNSLD